MWHYDVGIMPLPTDIIAAAYTRGIDPEDDAVGEKVGIGNVADLDGTAEIVVNGSAHNGEKGIREWITWARCPSTSNDPDVRGQMKVSSPPNPSLVGCLPIANWQRRVSIIVIDVPNPAPYLHSHAHRVE
jgi:hypothetical protein